MSIRWLAQLQQYDLEIQHIPGTTNTAADALSRLTPILPQPEFEDWMPFYLSDRHQSALLRPRFACTFGPHRVPPPSHLVRRSYRRAQAKQSEVIALHHDSIVSGHWGVAKTVAILKRHFKFPVLTPLVIEHVKTCDICQRTKVERRLQRGLLEPLDLTK